MKKTVLLIHPTILPVGIDILNRSCGVVTAPDGKPETVIRCINESRASAVITRGETISKGIIECCPTLSVIGQHGAGVDNIDVAAATANGVLVLNVPNGNFMSVAEHAIMFVLALSRNLVFSDLQTRQGNWGFRREFLPTEINGKTLAILGVGRIGQEVARKAKAFNMRVLGYDPYVTAEDMALVGALKAEDLSTCFAQADFVTIHLPLTAGTKHLIAADLLRRMKPTAYLLNLGRGQVVEPDALYAALRDRKIAGAALDALYHEPPKENDLLMQLENVILTPHVAGNTHEAKYRCSQAVAIDVVNVLEGRGSGSIVNPKALGIARLNTL